VSYFGTLHYSADSRFIPSMALSLKFGRESSESIKLLRFNASKITTKSFGCFCVFISAFEVWFERLAHPVIIPKATSKR
ncbi:MAG: hypothetical protein MUP22_06900, partial [Desulfobacterales bacterium]|nr:hypothetical protein [Desulfobacterales bacterium]